MSLFRRSVALGFVAALAFSAAPASAQMMGKPKEIRIDMLGVSTSDGTTGLAVGFPGMLTIAIYMNDNIAIEPQAGLSFQSGDGFSGGDFSLGVLVPYYLAGDQGKTGIFVGPGVWLGKGFGDFESDMAVNFGADVGIKRAWKTNVNQRFALTFRDGDSYAAAEIGVVAGIGIRW